MNNSKTVICPYCGNELAYRLLENARCQKCKGNIFVISGKLMTEEEYIDDWLSHLRFLKIKQRRFIKHREQLSAKAGGQANVNDTIWEILNSSVSKYVNNHRILYKIYLEMAELVAFEWKDPTLYLEQAGRYSPAGFAFLERAKDPIDTMTLLVNEGRFLEKQGSIEDAIALYKFVVKKRYPHPVPYERLRVFYGKNKKYKDAIKVCKAFLRVYKKVGYSERAKKFQEWVQKYENKL